MAVNMVALRIISNLVNIYNHVMSEYTYLGICVPYLIVLFYLLCYMDVKYGVLKKLKFWKNCRCNIANKILNVKKCTPNVMVLGELGRLPIDLFVNCRMLGFWHKLVTGNQNKSSCILYKLLLNLHVVTYILLNGL